MQNIKLQASDLPNHPNWSKTKLDNLEFCLVTFPNKLQFPRDSVLYCYLCLGRGICTSELRYLIKWTEMNLQMALFQVKKRKNIFLALQKSRPTMRSEHQPAKFVPRQLVVARWGHGSGSGLHDNLMGTSLPRKKRVLGNVKSYLCISVPDCVPWLDCTHTLIELPRNCGNKNGNVKMCNLCRISAPFRGSSDSC